MDFSREMPFVGIGPPSFVTHPLCQMSGWNDVIFLSCVVA